MFIVELETNVFLADWDGDPGRTLIKKNAKKFKNDVTAFFALEKARKYRKFKNGVVKLFN